MEMCKKCLFHSCINILEVNTILKKFYRLKALRTYLQSQMRLWNFELMLDNLTHLGQLGENYCILQCEKNTSFGWLVTGCSDINIYPLIPHVKI